MNKNNNKDKIKKPNFFIYYFLGPIAILWYKLKVKLIIKKDKRIEKGSLIMAPHRSYYDFITVPIAIYPRRVHVVSTTFWFRNKKLARLLRILGVIPKDQYKADIKAIKSMADVLKRNENILIFPEGQMSPYGRPLVLPNGMDKFIHKYKPNVYFVNTNGQYLNSSKWNMRFARRGVIEAEVIKIYSKEELENEPIENIAKKLNDTYKLNNDFLWIKKHPEYKYFKKEKEKGLENVISFCPKCLEAVPYSYFHNKVVCDNCKSELSFEKYSYNFKENEIANDLGELFDRVDNVFENKIKEGLELLDDARITYYDQLVEVPLFVDGSIKMNKKEIILAPKNNDIEKIIIYPEKIINMVITFGLSFEIPTPKCTYRIYPNNPKRAILYWSYLNHLKKGDADEIKD